jgi:hypothetical protein
MTSRRVGETRDNEKRTTGGKGAVRPHVLTPTLAQLPSESKVENLQVMNKSG